MTIFCYYIIFKQALDGNNHKICLGNLDKIFIINLPTTVSYLVVVNSSNRWWVCLKWFSIRWNKLWNYFNYHILTQVMFNFAFVINSKCISPGGVITWSVLHGGCNNVCRITWGVIWIFQNGGRNLNNIFIINLPTTVSYLVVANGCNRWWYFIWTNFLLNETSCKIFLIIQRFIYIIII